MYVSMYCTATSHMIRHVITAVLFNVNDNDNVHVNCRKPMSISISISRLTVNVYGNDVLLRPVLYYHLSPLANLSACVYLRTVRLWYTAVIK